MSLDSHKLSVLSCSVSQCVAVCRSVSQCVAVYRSVSQCVTVCRSVSQCVAVCHSVSQCVTVCCSTCVPRHVFRPSSGKILFLIVSGCVVGWVFLCVSCVCVMGSQEYNMHARNMCDGKKRWWERRGNACDCERVSECVGCCWRVKVSVHVGRSAGASVFGWVCGCVGSCVCLHVCALCACVGDCLWVRA